MKNIIIALLLFYFPLSAKTVKWIPFDISNGLIILKVKVKNHEIKAMFDTGAQRSLMDSDTAKKIGLVSKSRTTIHGIAGKISAKNTYKVYVEVGKVKTKVSPVKILGFQKKDKAKFDMILGADYLKKIGVVNIDYKNKKISFENLKSKDKKRHKIPLHVSSRKIYTKATANNRKKIRLIIDTGNTSAIFLKYKTAYKLGLREDQKTKSKSSGVTRDFSTYKGKLKSLKIGKLELKDVNTHFPGKDKKLKFNRSNYDGLLGYKILKDFLVTIDMKKKVMYLLEQK